MCRCSIQLGTFWIEEKGGKGKEKESRGKWFPSILFGLSMEGKEGNIKCVVWIEEGKERKGKVQVLVNL